MNHLYPHFTGDPQANMLLYWRCPGNCGFSLRRGPECPRAPQKIRWHKTNCAKYNQRHKRHPVLPDSRTCAPCGTVFVSHAQLREHRKTTACKLHKKFSCPTCGAVYARRTHLLRHQTTCGAGHEAECSKCGKSFPSRAACLVHARASGCTRLKHRCPKPGCGRTFTKKAAWAKHILTCSFHSPPP